MTIQLRLLGQVKVEKQGQKSVLSLNKQNWLVIYLAYRYDWVLRHDLLRFFYPNENEKVARIALRSLIYAVKQSGWPLECIEQKVRLLIKTDVAEFERLVNINNLDKALDIYQKDLFDNLNPIDFPDLDDYFTEERLRFREIWLKIAKKQAENLRNSGKFDQTADLYQKIWQQDRLNEQNFQDYLRIICEIGQRTQALQDFETFKTLLKNELDLDPLPETVKILEKCLTKKVREKLSVDIQYKNVGLGQIFDQFQEFDHDSPLSKQELCKKINDNQLLESEIKENKSFRLIISPEKAFASRDFEPKCQAQSLTQQIYQNDVGRNEILINKMIDLAHLACFERVETMVKNIDLQNLTESQRLKILYCQAHVFLHYGKPISADILLKQIKINLVNYNDNLWNFRIFACEVDIMIRTGSSARAIRTLEQKISSYSIDYLFELQKLLCKAYHSGGLYNQALGIAENLASSTQDKNDVYSSITSSNLLAKCLLSFKKYHQTKELLKAVLYLNPAKFYSDSILNTHLLLAKTYNFLGEIPLAYQHLQLSSKTCNPRLQILANLVSCDIYKTQKRYAEISKIVSIILFYLDKIEDLLLIAVASRYIFTFGNENQVIQLMEKQKQLNSKLHPELELSLEASQLRWQTKQNQIFYLNN